MFNPYERLANGIIEQAVKDYRRAARFLKKNSRTKELEDEVAVIRYIRKKDKKLRPWMYLSDKIRHYDPAEKLMIKIEDNERILRETEKFFLSDWFSDLTEINGKWLLERLKHELEVG